MTAPNLDVVLADEISALQKTHGDAIRLAEVEAVVQKIVTLIRDDLTAADERLLADLVALSDYISFAKDEIAQIRPQDVTDKYLPAAAEELDAIVEATAEATNAIIDATEAIEQTAGDLDGEAATTVRDQTTRIYEACGFQDITGQRVGKVVSTLQTIEGRIDAMIAVFGDEIARIKDEIPNNTSPAENRSVEDSDLLNGPQKKGEAISQADIDALLNDFD